MSLSEAMLELADEIDALVEQKTKDNEIVIRSEITAFSKQIRRLCKAAGNTPAVPFSPFDPRSDPIPGADRPAVAATQKALQRLQQKQQRMSDHAELEEGLADNMRLCVDGPEDGCHVSLHPAQTHAYVGGHFYTLKDDGKLHYQKPE